MRRIPRRGFLAGALAGCADAATGAMTPVGAGYRPEAGSDEAELWRALDRMEEGTRQSRFLLREPAIVDYVRDVACRLAPEQCGDLRVYVVRTAQFNASMAPNGMMQVWTGLLLRCENEAQLATVIGHEIGHYIERHSLKGMLDRRNKATAGMILSLGLGAAGGGLGSELAQLAGYASMFSFNRDQEREADAVGLGLMERAGYPTIEAAKVWENLIAENKAMPQRERGPGFFATHPAQEERAETLRRQAAQQAGPADARQGEYLARLRPIRRLLLQDELALRQFDRSLIVLGRLAEALPEDAATQHFTGEAYRLRDQPGDADRALGMLGRAARLPDALAETQRSLGMIHLARRDQRAANAAFRRYIELAPAAQDRLLIQSFIREGA